MLRGGRRESGGMGLEEVDGQSQRRHTAFPRVSTHPWPFWSLVLPFLSGLWCGETLSKVMLEN